VKGGRKREKTGPESPRKFYLVLTTRGGARPFVGKCHNIGREGKKKKDFGGEKKKLLVAEFALEKKKKGKKTTKHTLFNSCRS